VASNIADDTQFQTTKQNSCGSTGRALQLWAVQRALAMVSDKSSGYACLSSSSSLITCCSRIPDSDFLGSGFVVSVSNGQWKPVVPRSKQVLDSRVPTKSQNGTDDASISGGGPSRFSVVPAGDDSVSFFETFFLE
jgi:hypothetical protein